MTLLDDVTSAAAFALVRVEGSQDVRLLAGDHTDYEQLRDVPLETGIPAAGRSFDRLLCVPYAQIRERGFDALDDGTPLRAIRIGMQHTISVTDLLDQLPDEPIAVVGTPGFDTRDDEYADLVSAVLADEIAKGQGANLVVARHYEATIEGWNTAKALTVFRRLLEHERGAYWTFVVFTGDRYLIGASPERHLSVAAGEARMNPISGTFRLAGLADAVTRKQRLLDFLVDRKEVYELFMVVDEELKMMCDICGSGGRILGPYLKPMTHLIHTEYVLAGRTEMDVRDVLRRSMWAATVTGSPVENACKLIARYEQRGRGYYGAVLALLGRDPSGAPTLDAPILLRTADVGLDGRLRVGAGATLVRDSDPASEVAETHAKAGGVLSAFGLVPRPPAVGDAIAVLTLDPDVQAALLERNRGLSAFWLTEQDGVRPDPALAGKHVVVLDGEDDFVAMLMHILGVLGMTTERLRHRDYRPGVFDRADLVVVGPGPGDPRDLADPRLKAVAGAVDDLLRAGTPFLAVCLGHQVLCGALGLSLAYKDIVFQGTRDLITVDGVPEQVGFYNTFVARAPRWTTAVRRGSPQPPSQTSQAPGPAASVESVPGPTVTIEMPVDRGIGAGSVSSADDAMSASGISGHDSRIEQPAVDRVQLRLDVDPRTGDIHHLAGPHFRGIQFHAESILTENGPALVRRLARALLGAPPSDVA